jgi:hypothetical protein
MSRLIRRLAVVILATAVVAVIVATDSPIAEQTKVAEADADTGRVFTGDYSTGDFSQWPSVQNATYNGSGQDYVPTSAASIVSDQGTGNAARYELDSDATGGSQRSEVSADEGTGGTEGQTLWYQFSTKFDPAFPKNHRDLGWGLTNQWHQDVDAGSPPIGWYVDQRNGYWSLTIQKQSSPGVYLQTFSIFDVPLGSDWHDVKMQIRWSASDDIGFVRLWLNGVRQNFVNGSDTFYVRTLIPGTNTVYYKEGYYRKAMRSTGIVYHTGFRVATDESAL